MRVIAYTKYGREAASVRQRVLQYIPALRREGIEVEQRGLLGDQYVRSLATGMRWSRSSVMRSYGTRLRQVLGTQDADLVWVYADLLPYFPAAFEQRALGRKVPLVYDYDDAFFLAYNQSANPVVRKLLTGKLEAMMARSAAVICGNEYLKEYARRFCDNCVVVPTSVDTDVYRPGAGAKTEIPTIGWIGSPSSWVNVRPLLPLLQEFCAGGRARFRAIGAGVEAERDRFDGLELAAWSENSELEDVQGFDIGIMPLNDEPFQRAKSGYKLIQYMACGVPAIGSPVGVNPSILENGGGLLARTMDEWRSALTELLGDGGLRQDIGAAGRKEAVKNYSVSANAPRLVDLFRTVAARG